MPADPLSRRRALAAAIAVLPLLASLGGAQSQSLPAGYEALAGTSGTNYPLARTEDQVWHFVYDSAEFIAPVCIDINEISWRVDSGAVPAWNYQNFEVTLAYSRSHYAYATYDPVFANNMISPQVVRTGLWTGGPIAAASTGQLGAWVPFGLQQPFPYDPSLGLDLIIQVRTCGVVSQFGRFVDVAVGSAGGLGAMRYGNLSGCFAPTWNYTQFNPANDAAPILKIDFTLNFSGCGAGIGTYETNGLTAGMDVDGLDDPGAFAPMAVHFWSGEFAFLNVTATNAQVGLPWNIAWTPGAPTVPLGAGGLTTPGGQIVNLDLSVVAWALEPANPATAALFPGTTSIPFVHTPVTVPFRYGAQMWVADPSSADGFSLAHAQDVTVDPAPGVLMMEAVGPNDFNQDRRRGFWRIHHFGTAVASPADPITSVSIDWSQAVDPTVAQRYWVLDQGNLGDRFDGGNSVVSGCRGPYRKGSDGTCGLIYTNTQASPCDPTATTGWQAFNLSPAFPLSQQAQGLTFRFTQGSFFGNTFEFDANCVFGPGPHTGGSMAGLVVAITTTSASGVATTYTGALAPDVNDPERSFLVF